MNNQRIAFREGIRMRVEDRRAHDLRDHCKEFERKEAKEVVVAFIDEVIEEALVVASRKKEAHEDSEQIGSMMLEEPLVTEQSSMERRSSVEKRSSIERRSSLERKSMDK